MPQGCCTKCEHNGWALMEYWIGAVMAVGIYSSVADTENKMKLKTAMLSSVLSSPQLNFWIPDPIEHCGRKDNCDHDKHINHRTHIPHIPR